MKRTIVIVGFVTTFLLSSLIGFAQSRSRSEILKEIEAKRAELSALEKNFLAPAEEDRVLYASFLRQCYTGMIRLLPRDKFDSESNQKIHQSIVTRGGGSYYSFAQLTHEYGYGSDIELDHGEFSVGFAGADYGFMTNLGDIPIENVGEESLVSLFAAYKTPTQDNWQERNTIDFDKARSSKECR